MLRFEGLAASDRVRAFGKITTAAEHCQNINLDLMQGLRKDPKCLNLRRLDSFLLVIYPTYQLVGKKFKLR